MKKKILSVLLMVICSLVFSQNIGTFDKNRNTWIVDTGKIKCEFLEGCMYPSAFQKNGQYYPNFSLLDELQTPERKYYLKDERWANIKIIENTPDVFKVECHGRFGLNAAPRYMIYKKSDAVYCYTFHKNSGRVEMQAKVSVNDSVSVKYQLLCAGWLYNEFTDLIVNGKNLKTAVGRKISLSEGSVLKCASGEIVAYNNAEFNSSYKRYDKNSRLFQYITIPQNCGEVKKSNSANAELVLEFR